MGKNVENKDFNECLSKGRIKKFNPGVKLVSKELKSSKDDLTAGEASFADGNFKWATIQAYYSMFHAARALVYSKGYRERSHYCLIVALKVFFAAEGLLDIRLIEAIQIAKTLRENADYDNEFTKEGAQDLLEKAGELLERAKRTLKNVK